jgi:hypothetical protein
MQGILYGALRSAIHAAWALLVGLLAAHGLVLSAAQSSAWEASALVGVVGIVTTVAIKWLETRKGDGLLAKAERGLARLLMLGLTGRQPVYVPAGTTAVTAQRDGVPIERIPV